MAPPRGVERSVLWLFFLLLVFRLPTNPRVRKRENSGLRDVLRGKNREGWSCLLDIKYQEDTGWGGAPFVTDGSAGRRIPSAVWLAGALGGLWRQGGGLEVVLLPLVWSIHMYFLAFIPV